MLDFDWQNYWFCPICWGVVDICSLNADFDWHVSLGISTTYIETSIVWHRQNVSVLLRPGRHLQIQCKCWHICRDYVSTAHGTVVFVLNDIICQFCWGTADIYNFNAFLDICTETVTAWITIALVIHRWNLSILLRRDIYLRFQRWCWQICTGSSTPCFTIPLVSDHWNLCNSTEDGRHSLNNTRMYTLVPYCFGCGIFALFPWWDIYAETLINFS